MGLSATTSATGDRARRAGRGGARTKKPSSPLSPPSLMVAANAGDARRTVETPTTAACGDGKERKKRRRSVDVRCDG